jgi:hypothetical protein
MNYVTLWWWQDHKDVLDTVYNNPVTIATDRAPEQATLLFGSETSAPLRNDQGTRSAPGAQETRVCNITFNVSFLRLPETAAEILLSVVSACQHGVHFATFGRAAFTFSCWFSQKQDCPMETAASFLVSQNVQPDCNLLGFETKINMNLSWHMLAKTIWPFLKLQGVNFAVICMGLNPRQFYFPISLSHKINTVNLKKFCILSQQPLCIKLLWRSQKRCVWPPKTQEVKCRKRPWTTEMILRISVQISPNGKIIHIPTRTSGFRHLLQSEEGNVTIGGHYVDTPETHKATRCYWGSTRHSSHPDFRSERRRDAVWS